MQPSEPAVSNAGGLRRLLGNSLGFRETLGCRDIPAQGLTPPLHPRKGFHPLTRFRWRVPVELRLLAYAEVAEHPVQQPLLHLVAGDFRQGQLG